MKELNLKWKIIICVSIILVLCICCFLLGRFLRINNISTSTEKIEQSLKSATERMKLIEERNIEIEGLLKSSEETIILLEAKNEDMNCKLKDINKVCDEMEVILNNTSNSSDNILLKLEKIQINQNIMEEYFKYIKTILNEE